MVDVHEELSATNSPWPQRPVESEPEIRPASSILNQESDDVSAEVQEPPQEAI